MSRRRGVLASIRVGHNENLESRSLSMEDGNRGDRQDDVSGKLITLFTFRRTRQIVRLQSLFRCLPLFLGRLPAFPYKSRPQTRPNPLRVSGLRGNDCTFSERRMPTNTSVPASLRRISGIFSAKYTNRSRRIGTRNRRTPARRQPDCGQRPEYPSA